MTPTLCAILGRFNGDVSRAKAYCLHVANFYPTLRAEYIDHYEQLSRKEGILTGVALG